MDSNDTSLVARRVAGSRSGDELLWLAPGLLAATFVAAGYLLTHPYPAFGAGLFFLMAERISDAGYALPATVPYYTPEGVPFAYPPLLFYVLAALGDLAGQDAIFFSRHLPVAFTIVYLVPFYWLARRLDFSKPQASVATLVLAVSPPVLQWHISAGGVVRAGAFLLALVGAYAGCRLFQSGSTRWIAPTAVLVGLTALAHPLYLVFLLVTLAVFYVAFDRSVVGFVRGAAVGLGGLLIAAPWWTTVVATHGWEIFTSAAGTHGGIGEIVSLLLSNPSGSPADAVGPPYLYVPTLFAGAYLVHRRRLLLPTWFAVVGLTVGKPRFLFFFGALFVAALLFDPVIPGLRRARSGQGVTTQAVLSITLVVLLGSAGGVLYATSQLDAHAGSPSLPSFIDDDDREAMAWVAANTDESARFVVLGDAAEWFPYFAGRPITVSPWGVEWVDAEQYFRQLGLFKQLSRCERETCVTATLAKANVRPEYVYVPKGTYTVRGMQHERGPRLAKSLRSSGRYRQVYENEGVVIFRFVR